MIREGRTAGGGVADRQGGHGGSEKTVEGGEIDLGSKSLRSLLTFMSIQDEIRHRCSEGRLFELAPQGPGLTKYRMIFATPDVQQFLTGPWPTAEMERQAAGLYADLDVFIGGSFLDANYLKLLNPKEELVWEIRNPRPRPGLRLFCRFAMKDVLIATNLLGRDELKGVGSREWRDEIERCKALWSQLFLTYAAYPGRKINECTTYHED